MQPPLLFIVQIELLFSKQSKHIPLIGFYTRLVERIYPQHISTDATSKLEEIDKLAERIFIDDGEFDAHHWYATIAMRLNSSLFCTVIDFG